LARKILLADDSVTAQNMGRRILSDAGYDVTTVNNGSAALKKIAESKPDLIVLDVYMPGYGGLEVCQRLREAPETARIPVLLTVGKLEPFKAEEARRVRADGFIIKPFEASELLTALTKLEDKIVPQGQPAKPGRFAKASAGSDEFTGGKQFGDSETGWKNRLSIPPPHAKPRESEPEERPAAVASSRDAAKTEEHKPAEVKSGLEEAMLSSLPQDVTAEEIAAIKAAAAALNAPGYEPTLRQTARDQAESQGLTDAVEKLPSESTASENISAVAQAESKPNTETTTAAADVSAETVAQPAVIVSESSANTVPGRATTGKLGDEEVTAALASLAPENGNRDAAAIDTAVAVSNLATRDRVPVTMAAVATRQFNGPRWIAESVAVMEDEAGLVLEREMESAYAAFVAADAARMSFASSPSESDASLPVAETPATGSETASSPVEPLSNSDGSEAKSVSPAIAAEREESAAAEATLNVNAVGENAASEATENAAYAAAASAGPGPVEATMVTEAVSSPSPAAESSENVPPAPAPSGRQDESDLAAAWANWKQIRESVIGSQLSGSQLSSQIVDTVADFKETPGEVVPAPPASQPDVSGAAEDEANAISNIVDSVLADLKPKLMAEIAKKMGKNSKKN
jgi:CheY-like chemotaxis protein